MVFFKARQGSDLVLTSCNNNSGTDGSTKLRRIFGEFRMVRVITVWWLRVVHGIETLRAHDELLACPWATCDAPEITLNSRCASTIPPQCFVTKYRGPSTLR